jgi:hypothetical protein
MKKYTAKGTVWGNLWGGGHGGYRSKEVTGTTLQEIKDKATAMLADGSLDGGMGYESLYGAILNVKVEDIKTIDNKDYIHTDWRIVRVGKVSRKEAQASFEA